MMVSIREREEKNKIARAEILDKIETCCDVTQAFYDWYKYEWVCKCAICGREVRGNAPEDVVEEWMQTMPVRRHVQSGKDFGEVLEDLREGRYAGRTGWNGKGMWIRLQVPDEGSKMTLPYIYMKTAQGDLVPWLASQTDMLARDWQTWREAE